MERSSLAVRLARLGQQLPLGLLRPVELPALNRAGAETDRPNMLILLALPRSGSTLAYQVLCHALRPVYLSNLGHLLYQLPVIALSLSRWGCKHPETGFVSDEGFSPGLCGPAEGLRFWKYWFANGIDERKEAGSQPLPGGREAYLRKTVASVGTPEAPLVTGYVGHTLAVARLRRAFPHAVFVRLHRDPVNNALSLLECRRKRNGAWFSVFPKECEPHLDRPIEEQVAAQVYWLSRRLNEGMDENTVEISYEGLCLNPSVTVDRVVHFGNERGMRLETRRPLPDSFPALAGRCEGTDDERTVRVAFSELEQRYGPL